jgi:hypothetical protein
VGTVVVEATSIKTSTNLKAVMLDNHMVWRTTIISTNAEATDLAAWIIMACSKAVATLPRTSHSRRMMTTTKEERKAAGENNGSFQQQHAHQLGGQQQQSFGLQGQGDANKTAMLDGRTKPVAGVDPAGKAVKKFKTTQFSFRATP